MSKFEDLKMKEHAYFFFIFKFEILKILSSIILTKYNANPDFKSPFGDVVVNL